MINKKIIFMGTPEIASIYLDSLIKSAKGNEATESYFFHMVEDIEYEGNTVNINKFYEGIF